MLRSHDPSGTKLGVTRSATVIVLDARVDVSGQESIPRTFFPTSGVLISIDTRLTDKYTCCWRFKGEAFVRDLGSRVRFVNYHVNCPLLSTVYFSK